MKLKDSDKSSIQQPCKIDKSMIKYNIDIWIYIYLFNYLFIYLFYVLICRYKENRIITKDGKYLVTLKL